MEDYTLEQILASLEQTTQPPEGYRRAQEWAERWGVTVTRVTTILRLAQAQGKLDMRKVPYHDIAGRIMSVPAYRFKVL